MILTLQAVSLNDQALSRPITARFDAAGGTIGRADHSTMALPDPERFISRKQAEIVFVGDDYMIRNVGAANPITVASRSLAAGESTPLRNGDEVRIGGYLLRAECRDAAIAATVASGPRTVAPFIPSAAFPPAAPAPARPLAPAHTPAGAPARAPAPAPVLPAPPPIRPAPSARAGDNPFADLLGPAPTDPLAGVAGAPSSADPFADLLGGTPTPAARLAPTAPIAPTARLPAAAVAPTRPVAPPRSVPAAWAEKAPAPSLHDDDPFAGLMPAPAGLDPALGGVGITGRGGAGNAAARLPDDFDPFAAPSAARHGTPFEPTGAQVKAAQTGAEMPAATGADDPFADLFGSALPRGAVTPGGASIDQAFGLGPAAADGGDDDALARFVSDAGAPGSPAAAGGGLSTDPLLLFGGEAGAGAPPSALPSVPSARQGLGPAGMPDDHLPALHGAFTPPRVAGNAPRGAGSRGGGAAPAFIPATVVMQPPAAPKAPMLAPIVAPIAAPRGAPKAAAPAVTPAHRALAAAPSPSPEGGAATVAGEATLWRAFCEGAGVQLPALNAAATENRMRHVGRILRAAVEGTLQLISVRASTKHEMRAGVTQIQASSNNPLKFAADATAGVEQLLSPPQRGFMDGPAAMDDAMLDLVGHSIGTVAGMRAAIEGMLDRFDPAALEGKLGAGSRLANLLPMNRKAQLWELYLQHHNSIRDEAQEDFHTLFGRAFVAAYEQQVERLEQQRQQQRRAAQPPHPQRPPHPPRT